MRAAMLAAACLLAVPAWAQVYKCKDAGGRTVMQQMPCAGEGGRIEVRPASGYAPAAKAGVPAPVSDGQARLDKLKRDNEMAYAIRTGRPLVGMTREQLFKAMGRPKVVNANNYQGVQQEQNVFERQDGTWYVYTRSGVVESIQHRPGVPLHLAGGAPPQRCPTAHEIRDAEVSAGSLTLSPEERAVRLKAIEEMKACGRR